MRTIELHTAQRIIPMVYAYSTPEIARHEGHLKIGYTDRQSVEERIRQQGRTVDVLQKLEWKGSARFDDGSDEYFTDNDFRAYLRRLGYAGIGGTEYVKISVPESKRRFDEFRSNRGIVPDSDITTVPYQLREEQEEAVAKTCAYAQSHPEAEFLWNAKPRFGKTLAVYNLALRLGARQVLIVTNRPAIANSWYDDYEKFIGRDSGYFFVSGVDALQGRKLVMSRADYERDARTRAQTPGAQPMGCLEFVSLQDLKGAIAFGGEFAKLEHIAKTRWDLLVVDEAHEGVDTYRTDAAFDRIGRKFTLHLSGTPFRALASDKFPEQAIYNWTYADEQAKKENRSGEGANPYAALPKLNMFTYKMSEIVREELAQGIEIEGEQREYAFDLNEFFATNGSGRFLHESAVDRFLDALTTQEKFPFSTPALRDEIRHSFWLLNRVDSARALAKKLEHHPVFGNGKYRIVLAAGDGRMDEDDQAANARSLDAVRKAIRENEYTITLSVGQLTTGVTVPEWTAVLMLSSIRSPALYMQAAFRAQNPCVFHRGGATLRKENAYVFDFDPARTLIIYERFANDLIPATADGRGEQERRRENIRRLLNFFPVLGEDEGGEMVALDAAQVLSIPRRIKSREVVKSGFMNNYLFIDSIGAVFHAPQEVFEIIRQFTPVEQPKQTLHVTPDTAQELDINESGEVEVPEEKVIGLTQDLFGEKLWGEPEPVELELLVPPVTEEQPREARAQLRERITEDAVTRYVTPVITRVKEAYGSDFRKADQRRVESRLKNRAEDIVTRHESKYAIERKQLEQKRDERLQQAKTPQQVRAIERDFHQQAEEKRSDFIAELYRALDEFEETARREATREAETGRNEAVKREQESRIRDHLRGFSRTIPSFLMAYGDESVTLANFDAVIPDRVFREVTGITLDQFRRLRDGGEYVDEQGETHRYPGLFDETVFNDSVREFLRLRRELADYFREQSEGDIFDYIPPQKTNQIFTPRRVVREMVDLLEAEDPGCFDDGEQTFLDPYMKSGLYIAEIVKRLFRSEGMKRRFPDEQERLKHIFAHQVYGLAPTEIICRIAGNYILGFAEDKGEQYKHNLRQLDALPYAKDGTLATKLDALFGKKKR